VSNGLQLMESLAVVQVPQTILSATVKTRKVDGRNLVRDEKKMGLVKEEDFKVQVESL
jgi:hypothetical protein